MSSRDYIENGNSYNEGNSLKVPIVTSNVNSEIPVADIPRYEEEVSLIEISMSNRTVTIEHDWKNRESIKSNFIYIKKGNLRVLFEYTHISIVIVNTQRCTKLLATREYDMRRLYDFIGADGVPSATSAIISLSPESQNKQGINQLSDNIVHTKIIANQARKEYNLNVSWTNVNDAISNTFRWRPTPRIIRKTFTTFNVISGGLYDSEPIAQIVSDYGNEMRITLNTSQIADQYQIDSIIVDEEGYDYISAPTLQITPSTSTPAEITSDIAVSNEGGVTFVRVLAPGSGYIDKTSLVFSGGSGTGASGYINVENGAIVSVTMTDTGYGYTSEPIVTTSIGTGATFKSNVSLYSDWYYNDVDISTHSYQMTDLKSNIQYEYELFTRTSITEEIFRYLPKKITF